jgi:NitT/TauT family transport system permease protein
LALLFALTLWQAAAMALGQPLLLPSPIDVIGRLLTIWEEPGFFVSVVNSFLRIVLGFLLGLCAGVLLALPASRLKWLETLLWPYVQFIKSTPVASFVILALIWLSSARLSTFISMLMVFPVVYLNALKGFGSVPPQMAEMAALYAVPFSRRLKYLYVPALRPSLLSASSIALGLCFKAGIAAELIGVPQNTIGERLYEAKIYLNTVDVFAWTAVIIVISALFEKAFLRVLQRLLKRGTKA